jgi:N-acetylmuramoyl-L-alanine amidase
MVGYNLITEWLPMPSRSRPGIANRGITSITIHWIGPYPNQSVYTPYYWWRDGTDGQGVTASAHYIVKNKDVLHCVPDDEVAWHCGSEGNYTSIGIEVVPATNSGMFGADTISTLKALLKTLPDVPLKRHYDWTSKDCPRYYTPLSEGGSGRWDELVKELRR